MNEKTVSRRHIIALSILYVLGNGILIFPLKGTDQFGFTAYLVSLLLLMVAYCIFNIITSKLSQAPKVVFCSLIIVISVASLFIGAKAFLDMVDFMSETMLQGVPTFFISLIFGITAIYFALKPMESIFKFSLVTCVFVVGIILFFFLAPMEKYELRNIYIFRLPNLNFLLPQVKVYLLNPVLQSLSLPLFFYLCFGKTCGKPAFVGVALGGVFLGICLLAPILLFGAYVGGEFAFPFSSAAETVTVGRLFTRLDGFVFFIYFITCLVKVTVCLKVSLASLKRLKEGFGNNRFSA